MAKDYRHQPTLAALEELVEGRGAYLIVPRQTLDEFARNKDRIIRDSGKSLSGTFKRVKEAVRQFGTEDGKKDTLATLDDIDHRITILGEAVNESIRRIERLMTVRNAVETSDAVKLRAAQRAIEKRAPFHKEKNSIGDAILIEIYRDAITNMDASEAEYAFITHNKHDFSNMAVDEREPHPDLADLFASEHSTYSLALGEVLSQYAPEFMEDIKWEFEYQEEPRRLSEIMEAENLLFRQIWYNRHRNLRIAIERGKHRVVTMEEWEKHPKRRNKTTVDTIWASALIAAKRTEEEVGVENLGPWTDFEWGMLNGKLSALRWVTGSEWDFLDT
jgi:hypothetical protein